MRNLSTRRSALAAALLLSTASGAWAQEAPADAPAADEADGIVVTARNREEDINDVPIPITVLSGDTVAQQRVFTIADLTQRSPGLTATTPNARRTGVSLRGIGKTSGNDNMEAAVGAIVDDVFLGHVGMTYQDFTDLQQVEILRGPQGTLLGKNTSLGVIKYTTKAPTFDPEGTLELEKGFTRRAFKARGSYSTGLVQDVLAFRASFFLDKQDGDILNINPARGGRWHERNRWGGRFQLLFKPSSNFSLKLNADSAETNENSNTKPWIVDPATLDDGSPRTSSYSIRLARSYFNGYTPIIGSTTTIDMDQAEPLITRNSGVSLVADWDVGPVQLKSISAWRTLHFDAKNDSEQTRFPIARGGTLVDTEQLSQELRISGNLTNRIDFQAGLYLFKIDTETTSRNLFGRDAGAFYASSSQYAALNTAANLPFLRASLENVFSTTYQNPVSKSEAVFAQANWKLTDRFTVTGGVRYTWEQKDSITTRAATYVDGTALVATGNSTADAIRSTQLGAPYADIKGEPIRDGSFSWLINPSFKITDDVLLYASASGGGKSGAVAFLNDGTLANVLPERTTDFELGVKGAFFANALQLSVNLYNTRVRNYQNVTSYKDDASATGFSSRLGNIPGLRARGVELDGHLRVSDALSFNFGGAFNDAVYTDWSNATCPRNVVTTKDNPTCNNTGKQVVGAPKWNVIIGFNVDQPIGDSGFTLRVFANDTWRSSHNLEQLLSPYGFQKGYHLTDAGIGVAKELGGVETEFSIVAKNLFDTQYTTSVNDFSNNAPVGYDGVGPRRYVGALLRVKY
ncbi:TonB-dependent receptor [Novosphingobium cyanobacteriorum]|uniref:TonB-dependent receptor n=1 Tax=Novosphingobium cyanobacteriorum TaxID=3024215 RepID=A0ABT6CL98_9SPHN|nr:TonB-dependent receptor [Novosphingobium cyanobacteriorum]MDF8334687.1 TonB-dependent receptor [Novosphingobium cyanobacteriorum]